MKLHPTKAAGSFDLHGEGSFELIVHMEADPRALSFARFNFQSILPRGKACAFFELPSYLLRHEAGLFVIAVTPSDFSFNSQQLASWQEADNILASRNTWLFATTYEDLRREPHWSNARKIASCARTEVDPTDQTRVIDFLSEAGQARLVECARRCQASVDSYDAALKLVSSGVLHFDTSGPLSLDSQVRLKPHHPSSRVAWLQTRPQHTPRAASLLDGSRY